MGRLESILATRLKRKSQTCKVFEIKVDKSHLSKKSIDHLYALFKEAKWFYNYCISQEDINEADTTLKSVPVKVVNNFENRSFVTLKSHMKQGIKKRIFTNLKSLSSRKKNGHRVGKLKFKSQLNSVPLPACKHDFDIDFIGNRMRLSGLKHKMKVMGLKQIPVGVEIANATFIRKSNDFYFHIITFTPKEERAVPESSIGIDFGCESQLTFSNGIKLEFQVPVSRRLRKLDRKIMRKKRSGSKSKYKDELKRQKEYEKLINRKKDIRQKIVSTITNNFKYICFQDESIHAWHSSNHGKKIQNSGIGGILSDLKHKSVTPIEVDKFFPSTQLCPQCGKRKKLTLSERIYECECGYKKDRDIKSALCIEAEGMKQIPMDRRKLTLRENPSSTFFDILSSISGVKVSKVIH